MTAVGFQRVGGGKLRRKRLDQDQASQLLAESSGDRSGGHLVGKIPFLGGWVAGAHVACWDPGLVMPRYLKQTPGFCKLFLLGGGMGICYIYPVCSTQPSRPS